MTTPTARLRSSWREASASASVAKIVAIAATGSAKVGAPQPSTATPIAVDGTPASSAIRAWILRWRGCSGSRYVSSGQPFARATASIPACFPEQLLWSAVGFSPAARSASAEGAWRGSCGPHWSCAGSRPALARTERTASRWNGSPLCDAAMTASSVAVRPSRSARPSSTSGSSWTGLAAERRYARRSGSPTRATIPPSRPPADPPRARAAWTSWIDSISAPRQTRTPWGSGVTVSPARQVRREDIDQRERTAESSCRLLPTHCGLERGQSPRRQHGMKSGRGVRVLLPEDGRLRADVPFVEIFGSIEIAGRLQPGHTEFRRASARFHSLQGVRGAPRNVLEELGTTPPQADEVKAAVERRPEHEVGPLERGLRFAESFRGDRRAIGTDHDHGPRSPIGSDRRHARESYAQIPAPLGHEPPPWPEEPLEQPPPGGGRERDDGLEARPIAGLHRVEEQRPRQIGRFAGMDDRCETSLHLARGRRLGEHRDDGRPTHFVGAPRRAPRATRRLGARRATRAARRLGARTTRTAGRFRPRGPPRTARAIQNPRSRRISAVNAHTINSTRNAK